MTAQDASRKPALRSQIPWKHSQLTKKNPSISQAELSVLKAIWSHGPGTVRQINSVLASRNRHWAYTTVLTLLSRLRSKGYVSSAKLGAAHVFQAVLSKRQLLQRRFLELADQFTDGESIPLVQTLMEAGRFSADEIQQIRGLLDELEQGASPDVNERMLRE